MGRNAEKNREQREKTRTSLIEAGRKIILKKRIDRIQVRDVAREARVGVGTFYLYFNDLQSFFLEGTRQAVEEIRGEVRKARGLQDGSAESDPLQRIRRAFEIFFDAVEKNREMFLMLILRRHDAGPYGRLIRKAFSEFVQDLTEDLETASKSGFTVPLSPRLVAEALLGMSLHIAQVYAEQNGNRRWLGKKEAVDTLTALSLTGMLKEGISRG
ncbi:MAG: TetR/AcrR family transcriptional regulator [Nitrospirae bacterium]|nr:TetR/AcrR family transcriptional regulator [Nitrospirota bacterium]